MCFCSVLQLNLVNLFLKGAIRKSFNLIVAWYVKYIVQVPIYISISIYPSRQILCQLQKVLQF